MGKVNTAKVQRLEGPHDLRPEARVCNIPVSRPSRFHITLPIVGVVMRTTVDFEQGLQILIIPSAHDIMIFALQTREGTSTLTHSCSFASFPGFSLCFLGQAPAGLE